MSGAWWDVAATVLLICGPVPGLYLAARGTPTARLVGLQLAGATAVMILLALALADGQSSYLIVPLVLAILLVTGTLVFTRVVRQHGHHDQHRHHDQQGARGQEGGRDQHGGDADGAEAAG